MVIFAETDIYIKPQPRDAWFFVKSIDSFEPYFQHSVVKISLSLKIYEIEANCQWTMGHSNTTPTRC